MFKDLSVCTFALLVAAGAGYCFEPQDAAAQASPPSSAPAVVPTLLPFDAAVMSAANDLFTKANIQDAPPKVLLVIDPLIDGVTGVQSNATRSMEKSITDLVQKKYQRFEVIRFTSASLAKSPVVLIGTFTAINNAGAAAGPKDAYRICLALADLNAKKIISKGVARALPEGVDPTPTAFFNESPVFVKDASIEAYVKSCQGTRPGDPIDQVYADRILVASLVNDGIEAYNARRYRDALDLYRGALRTPGGEQLRVLNGMYLADNALGRRKEAMEDFGRVVDYGLRNNQLAIKFLFKPGSTQFIADRRIRGPYDAWLQKVAERTSATKACLEVIGHTSATGLAAMNDRLSGLRAEYVKDRLEAESSDLRERLLATGKGSRELIVGTGRDDSSDALDRRVEFKTVKC